MMSASPRRIDLRTPRRSRGRPSRRPTRSEVRPGHPEADRDLAAPTLGMPIGMRNGLIRSGPRGGVGRDAVEERADAAEPGPEEDAGPLGVLALEPGRQAGLVHRLARGDEPELDVAVDPAQVLAVEDAARRRSRATSPAICEVSRDGSKASIVRTPDRPATRPAQVDGDVVARARSACPCPVTTTRAAAGRRRAPVGHRTSFPVRTVAAR